MMVFQPRRLHAIATAVAFAAGSSLSMFASGLSTYSISDCADLAPFTAGDILTDDVSIFLEDSLALTCDQVRCKVHIVTRGSPPEEGLAMMTRVS